MVSSKESQTVIIHLTDNDIVSDVPKIGDMLKKNRTLLSVDFGCNYSEIRLLVKMFYIVVFIKQAMSLEAQE